MGDGLRHFPIRRCLQSFPDVELLHTGAKGTELDERERECENKTAGIYNDLFDANKS